MEASEIFGARGLPFGGPCLGERNDRKVPMLSPNMEDYLEVIYRLSKGERAVRVSEIAEAIQVRRPSVSKALKRLVESGHVEHSPYGEVSLTDRGTGVAEWQVHSHQVLCDFLVEILGIADDEAEFEACQIEHTAGVNTVDQMERFLDFLKKSPAEVREWISRFHVSTRSKLDESKGSGRSSGDPEGGGKRSAKSGDHDADRIWTSRI